MGEPDFLRDTRASYDAVAADYTRQFRDELSANPWNQAVLATFAEAVQGGRVLEVGCGPGRVTAYLSELGLDVSGVDLSPRMIEIARDTVPGLRFEVGSMTALAVADGALDGLVAWYSTMYFPPERMPEVFLEFHRVLGPGGFALLAFQAGDEVVHLTEGFGHTISLTSYRRRPDRVAALLGDAGLEVRATLLREPEGDGAFAEKDQQAYLLARKKA
jgi:SAM-dependent methyltransferase